MSPLDIVIAVVVGFCLIRGIFRGFVKEVTSIIGVFAGYYAAYTYYPELARPLSAWIENTAYLNIVSFLIIFCWVFLAVSLVGVVLKYLFKVASLGWFDRLSGAAFGLAKGALITSVLVLALTTFLPKGDPIVKESLMARWSTSTAQMLIKIVPQEMKDLFLENLEALKKTWKEKV